MQVLEDGEQIPRSLPRHEFAHEQDHHRIGFESVPGAQVGSVLSCILCRVAEEFVIHGQGHIEAFVSGDTVRGVKEPVQRTRCQESAGASEEPAEHEPFYQALGTAYLAFIEGNTVPVKHERDSSPPRSGEGQPGCGMPPTEDHHGVVSTALELPDDFRSRVAKESAEPLRSVVAQHFVAISLEQGHIPCDDSIEARVLIGLGALQAGVKHCQFDFRPLGNAPEHRAKVLNRVCEDYRQPEWPRKRAGVILGPRRRVRGIPRG